MKKSVVSTAVTTMFVVYSLYQRAFGVEASAGAVPNASPVAVTTSTSQSTTTSASQSSSSSQAQAPVRSSTSSAAQTSSTQTQARNTQTSTPQSTPTPTQQAGSQLKDGTYTGAPASAFYGELQVQATVANGKLTNIQFPQWPNDRSRSIRINQQALPMLTQEAIQAQSANVDTISGATDTSQAFVESLQSALGKAQGGVGQVQSASGQANG